MVSRLLTRLAKFLAQYPSVRFNCFLLVPKEQSLPAVCLRQVFVDCVSQGIISAFCDKLVSNPLQLSQTWADYSAQ